MAGITSRGSWDFAGVVAYALCSYADSIVYNDSCVLTGQEEYSAKEPKGHFIQRLILKSSEAWTEVSEGYFHDMPENRELISRVAR